MKVKVNNKIYNVIRKIYDGYYDCYLYYIVERDEPLSGYMIEEEIYDENDDI